MNNKIHETNFARKAPLAYPSFKTLPFGVLKWVKFCFAVLALAFFIDPVLNANADGGGNRLLPQKLIKFEDDINLIAALFTIIGLPTIFGYLIRILCMKNKRNAIWKFVGFDKSKPIHVATSSVYIPWEADRDEVVLNNNPVCHEGHIAQLDKKVQKFGIGTVKAVQFISIFKYIYYPNLPIEICSSRDPFNQKSDPNIIYIGGPRKNVLTKRFIERVNEEINEKINFDETVGTLDISVFGEKAKGFHGKTDRDNPNIEYALIVLWNDETAEQEKREILCAGMSSSGTAVAAKWFFITLLVEMKKKSKNLLKEVNKKIPTVAIVLTIEYNGDPQMGIGIVRKRETIVLTPKKQAS